MFDDVLNTTVQHKEIFSDTVKDEVGRSIVTEVFEPIIEDMAHLQDLEEHFKSRAAEIDQITEELQSIEGNPQ